LEQNFVEQFCAWSGLNFDEIWNGKDNDILNAMKASGFYKQLEIAKNANAAFMLKLNQ
jgi:hypothetical protein